MSRWSNRFISTCTVLLLTACRSSPWDEPPAPAHEVAGPEAGAAANDATSGAAGSATSGTAAAGATANRATSGDVGARGNPAGSNTSAAASVPVPPQAAQQYTDALKLMKAGRVSDAELQFKQLNAAYPQYAGPPANLGLIYLQTSQLPAAESAFKTALERNPANGIAGNELGIVERKLGKFAEAEAAYQRTIAAEPDYAPTYLNLGVLYDLYLGQPQKALEQYEHYVQLTGENKQVAGWMVELRKRVGAAAPPAKKEPS